MLSDLAIIIKPNTLLVLYVVYSPFFDIQQLNNLPDSTCKIDKMHYDLFDIDFYLFKIDGDTISVKVKNRGFLERCFFLKKIVQNYQKTQFGLIKLVIGHFFSSFLGICV